MISHTTQFNSKKILTLLISTREEPESKNNKHKWIVKILDVKYKLANRDEVVAKIHNLSSAQRNELIILLHKYKDLFDSTFGDFETP